MSEYQKLYELAKLLNEVAKKAEKASQARFNLPHGSSRAKVTTANARWMVYAESRENYVTELKQELKKVGII